MKILFAVKIGAEAWEEELITEVEPRIDAARAWARAHGYDRFRVATIDLDLPPNFAATLNNKKKAKND